MRRRQLIASLALPAGLWPGAGVLALDAPVAPVVLTVTGAVQKPNRGAQAVFDMPMLERMPQQHLVTRTPWYAQARKFTGPLLRDVLSECGCRGSVLRATALNNYRVDIPFDDVMRFDVVLARLMDDKPMPVRDKGPLFIVYPFDARAELRNALYYSRAAWQLKLIEVM